MTVAQNFNLKHSRDALEQVRSMETPLTTDTDQPQQGFNFVAAVFFLLGFV